MQLKSLDNINLSNKNILVRVDLNVPFKNGKVQDLTRIQAIKPTINFLKEHNTKIALCSHFGRPKGQPSSEYSLSNIIQAIETIIEVQIKFIPDCIDTKTIQSTLQNLKENQILLLENTRFYKEEENNNLDFAKTLAQPFDLFINDAFGTAHRAHASTEGVTNFLPSYPGLLMSNEIKSLSPLLKLKQSQLPLTIILAGAKIDTKIGVIKQFIGKAQNILIGGALANTFLLAQGYKVGKSLVEPDKILITQEILQIAKEAKTNILLPIDVITASEITEQANTQTKEINNIHNNDIILDIGEKSQTHYNQIINQSKTIIVNGPVGLYELTPFTKGTQSLFKKIAQSKNTTIVGGGDTLDALAKFKIPFSSFTHVSTGGGAMIEFLEGQTLPGITPLLK